MDVGLMYTLSAAPDRPAADAYADFVALAQAGERLGYRSLYSTEHHFGSDPEFNPFGHGSEDYAAADYDLVFDALSVFTWVAAHTKTIRLGTGLSILHWDHPLRVAERAALLDVVSGGRLEFGVGKGQGFREARVFNVTSDADEATRKFNEAVEVIMLAWEQEVFSYHGEYFDFDNIRLRPRPLTKKAPLYYGVASEGAARFAAKYDVPFIANSAFASPEGMIARWDAYQETAAASGLDVSRHMHPHLYFGYVAETDEEAEELGFQYFEQYNYILEQHYERHGGHPEYGVLARNTVLPEAEHAAIARRIIATQAFGSPATCVEKLNALSDEVGFDYMVVQLGFGNQPIESTIKQAELFAKEVMPHLRTGSRRLAYAGSR